MVSEIFTIYCNCFVTFIYESLYAFESFEIIVDICFIVILFIYKRYDFDFVYIQKIFAVRTEVFKMKIY